MGRLNEATFLRGNEIIRHKGYTLESYTLNDNNSSILFNWQTQVFPELQKLFNTTWPALSTLENASWMESFYRNILAHKGSVAILVRDDNKNLVGFSVGYSMKLHRELQGETVLTLPWDETTAYNSSVVIHPNHRHKGIGTQMIEEQMRQLSLLGYTHMKAFYNANSEEVNGTVRQGLARFLLTHTLNYGKPVDSTPLIREDSARKQEHIVFQLRRPIHG